MILRHLLAISCFVCLAYSQVAAADLDKIAVVDFKQVIDNTAAGKAVQSKIKEKGEQLKQDLEKAQTELMEMQKEYQREANLWTQTKKAEKERVFKAKLNALNKQKLASKNEYDKLKAEAINQLKAEMVSHIEKMASKKKYFLVIEKASGEILYMNSSADITKAVISKYEN